MKVCWLKEGAFVWLFWDEGHVKKRTGESLKANEGTSCVRDCDQRAGGGLDIVILLKTWTLDLPSETTVRICMLTQPTLLVVHAEDAQRHFCAETTLIHHRS